MKTDSMATRLLARRCEETIARLTARFAHESDADAWAIFVRRVREQFPRLFSLLFQLYGERDDFFVQLDALLDVAAHAWLARSDELKQLDAEREVNPRWFQANSMLGGVCYVDLFAGDLAGVREKIPYFKELGLTYLHLMPLFKCPSDNSDGGYAVSSYREVAPALGTMDELRALATELRRNGISLVVDFIFNHTSDEHEWAQRAKAGERAYQDFYWIFPDRALPDAYEKNLREIFPDEHAGAFTKFEFNPHPPTPSPVAKTPTGEGEQRHPPTPSPVAKTPIGEGEQPRANDTASPATHPERSGAQSKDVLQGLAGEVWVWTTFHTFQWDLNYANPAVFNHMAAELLFLANVGIEVLRLDAVAFIWKQLGTGCENLPEAHTLIQAFNAIAQIAAPALLFKSEAIVHPDEVVKYIHPAECQLSYNPLLMALLWNSLATRKTRLLSDAVRKRFAIHPACAWVNYVRCHDDIGWTFSDEDAALLGVKGHDHRQFLNQFYTGRFAGSFARGLPFQENPKTGDCRISGMGASLAGLEQALATGDANEIELALRRILLIHGIILSIGGIPLIYLGDEIGMLNDYSYRADPHKAEDSRWAHRPRMDWRAAAQRHDARMTAGQIYTRLQRLIALRKEHGALTVGATAVLDLDNAHTFGYVRRAPHAAPIVVLANFGEAEQTLTAEQLRAHDLRGARRDLISGASLWLDEGLRLEAYGMLWLQ